MIINGWNYRGLGRPRAVRALCGLTSSYNPSILGLSETKLSSKTCDMLRVTLGFQNCFAVDSKGRSGGLALLWKSDIEVEICSYNNYHIDALVMSSSPYRITLFYGNPRMDKRKESWDLLRLLEKKT